MPIMIEDMQAEVLPERAAPEEASASIEADTPRDTRLLERMLRERRVRDERRLRWWAD